MSSKSKPTRSKRKPQIGPQDRKLKKSARHQRLARQADRIEPTLPAVERAALQNPALLVAILMSLFNRRSLANTNNPASLPISTWYRLAQVPLADCILTRSGAGWSQSKDVTASVNWPASLRWGLDHYVHITFLVRAGKLTAAALSTRMYLERWTLNVAHTHEIHRVDGETDAQFVTRAWSVYSSSHTASHDMGMYWRWLSELLHGRPELAAAWPNHKSGNTEYANAGNRILTISGLTFPQVLGALHVHAQESGHSRMAETLFKESVSPRTDWLEGSVVADSLHQLDFGYTSSATASKISRRGSDYRKITLTESAARQFRDTISLDYGQMAFIERRGRAIDAARDSFEHEMQIYGDEFDPYSLNARLFRYIGIAEMARLLGETTRFSPDGMALLAAADALESAWYVWLEDSDLSLGCIRILIEQTARARAHRIKPTRAQSLESSPTAAAPIRWLETAGFKRLGSYNQALGQFSHIYENLRIHGARQLLGHVHSSPNEYTAETARGDAVNEAAYLLAHEVAERLEGRSPRLAELFRNQVTLQDQTAHDQQLNEMLNRSLENRGADLGPSIFVKPPAFKDS